MSTMKNANKSTEQQCDEYDEDEEDVYRAFSERRSNEVYAHCQDAYRQGYVAGTKAILDSFPVRDIFYAGEVANLSNDYLEYEPKRVFSDPVLGTYLAKQLNSNPYTRTRANADSFGIEAMLWLQGWFELMKEMAELLIEIKELPPIYSRFRHKVVMANYGESTSVP